MKKKKYYVVTFRDYDYPKEEDIIGVADSDDGIQNIIDGYFSDKITNYEISERKHIDEGGIYFTSKIEVNNYNGFHQKGDVTVLDFNLNEA